MANNQYINKVIYGGDILIDLTTDSVSAADVLSGKTFHLPSGEQKTGTCAYDADTSDATANAAEILISKTAYKNGSKVTGTMPNRESVVGTITTKEQEYTVPQGYHDGGGKVSIDSTEQGKLTPELRAAIEQDGLPAGGRAQAEERPPGNGGGYERRGDFQHLPGRVEDGEAAFGRCERHHRRHAFHAHCRRVRETQLRGQRECRGIQQDLPCHGGEIHGPHVAERSVLAENEPEVVCR